MLTRFFRFWGRVWPFLWPLRLDFRQVCAKSFWISAQGTAQN